MNEEDRGAHAICIIACDVHCIADKQDLPWKIKIPVKHVLFNTCIHNDNRCASQRDLRQERNHLGGGV